MLQKDLDWRKIALFLKIGILGASVILAGDLLMGWGVRDTGLTGMEAQLSPYLGVSDGRMFWAAIFGFAGVPLAVLGHCAVYRLIKPYSRKYARLYAIGILAFLTLGGIRRTEPVSPLGLDLFHAHRFPARQSHRFSGQ